MIQGCRASEGVCVMKGIIKGVQCDEVLSASVCGGPEQLVRCFQSVG